MTAATWAHTTVLLTEAVEAVAPYAALDEGAADEADPPARPEGTYVDGTFGRGGHSRALLTRVGPGARLVAFDKDPEAVAAAQALVASDARFAIVHDSFAAMREALAARGVTAVDGVLLDLGVSSPQIDNPERGFSFRFDAPLDMRMDTTRGETAADFLARADERRIAEVIRDYGEERFAVQVAKALVARREGGNPVRTTGELSQVVARAVKTREPGQDPATRTFQALRILVNAELEELEQGLNAALALLAPGGRLAVISFHSLEDRIVKTFIARESRDEVDRRAPFAPPKAMRLRSLGRFRPGAAELAANPRARSAILRVAERTTVGAAA
ncbi:16S rRNA (cytosine(1402)-N(4))-methyltransferase RsmH [Ideonella sp. A 288]|uniref:16S rRNA (cytosine(1402)-N(4))-methyltransferase RsmH n=1 Tax=Ideonella sp. A 288 TaxID=1962181 RepID=UPI000B4A95F3|nr:16S rRNA (cytosine(1402)-N(4))-methyltransferase RsmH [Ideonella sp. A 288]